MAHHQECRRASALGDLATRLRRESFAEDGPGMRHHPDLMVTRTMDLVTDCRFDFKRNKASDCYAQVKIAIRRCAPDLTIERVQRIRLFRCRTGVTRSPLPFRRRYGWRRADQLNTVPKPACIRFASRSRAVGATSQAGNGTYRLLLRRVSPRRGKVGDARVARPRAIAPTVIPSATTPKLGRPRIFTGSQSGRFFRYRIPTHTRQCTRYA